MGQGGFSQKAKINTVPDKEGCNLFRHWHLFCVQLVNKEQGAILFMSPQLWHTTLSLMLYRTIGKELTGSSRLEQNGSEEAVNNSINKHIVTARSRQT